MNRQTAAGTIEYTGRQRHLLPVSTPGTILGGVGRVHGDESPTSVFSFVGEACHELGPGCVHDALGNTMVVHHSIDCQVFHSNDLKVVDDAPAVLVGEVTTAVGDALMDSAHHLSALLALDGALGLFGQTPLSPGQGLLFPAEEARVLNGGPVAQGGEGGQSHVNAHHSLFRRQRAWFPFAGKGRVPLARSRAADADGFGDSFQSAVKDYLDSTNLGQVELVPLQLAAAGCLGKGETIVAPGATEPGIAWLLSGPHPSEEGLQRQVNAEGHVLEHLAVDRLQGWPLCLQWDEALMLVVEGDAGAACFPGQLALFQQAVVEPAALFQCLVHHVPLFGCGVEPVQECLTHMSIITQKEAPYIPRPEGRGFTAQVW